MEFRNLLCLSIFVVASLCMSVPGQALEFLSGDQVSIDTEIMDDVFASGGIVTLNAPVDGLVVAGGEVTVNAPVRGDLFVAGGQIHLNSDVDGKIVAAGGNLDIGGTAENLIAAGGNIIIRQDAEISRDAVVSGGNVNFFGKVNGTLTIRSGSFDNSGQAGTIDYQETAFMEGFQAFVTVFSIILTIGFLILGLAFIWIFPRAFSAVEERVRTSTIKTTLMGFVMAIASVVVIVLLGISLIGIPLAMIMGMVFITALMLSTLPVSYSLGARLLGWLRIKTRRQEVIFIIGFVVLNLVFRIPIAGWIVMIIAVSLGYGAIFYAAKENWKRLTKR